VTGIRLAALLDLVQELQPKGDEQWGKLTKKYVEKTGVCLRRIWQFLHFFFAAEPSQEDIEKQIHPAFGRQETNRSRLCCFSDSQSSFCSGVQELQSAKPRVFVPNKSRMTSATTT